MSGPMRWRPAHCKPLVACLVALWLVPLPWPVYGASEKTAFQVLYAETQIVNKVLRLNAGFDVRFSPQLEEAIHRGVEVVVVIEVDAIRERSYLWNEAVARVTQRYQIRYSDLTRRYIVHNLNVGTRFSLPSLTAVTAVIASMVDFPFLDYSLLQSGERYLGRIRVGVDVESLPVPLRLRAYVSPAWHMTSRWFIWRLQP